MTSPRERPRPDAGGLGCVAGALSLAPPAAALVGTRVGMDVEAALWFALCAVAGAALLAARRGEASRALGHRAVVAGAACVLLVATSGGVDVRQLGAAAAIIGAHLGRRP